MQPYGNANINCRNKRQVCIKSGKNLETVKKGGSFKKKSSQGLLSKIQRDYINHPYGQENMNCKNEVECYKPM